MGFERDCYRWNAKFAGAGDDLFNDPLMATMHAIEVADGGDGGAVVGGDIGDGAKYFHAFLVLLETAKAEKGINWFFAWSDSSLPALLDKERDLFRPAARGGLSFEQRVVQHKTLL